MSDDQKADYLQDGGWIQDRRGWWHPPHCLASWPLDEAYRSAKDDEKRGLRMSPAEVREYPEEVSR